jgi:hypothetical protein
MPDRDLIAEARAALASESNLERLMWVLFGSSDLVAELQRARTRIVELETGAPHAEAKPLVARWEAMPDTSIRDQLAGIIGDASEGSDR